MPENACDILVVDDDEIILLALRESLTHRGYRVVTTPNPLEALEHMEQRTFGVVISDQRMAEMNGLEFLKLCKERRPETVRIMITGVQTMKTLIEAVNQCEIFRFVGKPWVREDLLQAIESAANHYKALAACRLREKAHLAKITELEARLAQGVTPTP